jgi:hypothetical protein
MPLDGGDLAFIAANPSAAMITVGSDGIARAVRVAVGVIDGHLWSSGTRARRRTDRLRIDPRCTVYVHDGGHSFLTLETTVTIIDGPQVPADTVRLFRALQHKPEGPLTWFGGELAEADFLQAMVDDGRILYEFEVHRSYGMR